MASLRKQTSDFENQIKEKEAQISNEKEKNQSQLVCLHNKLNREKESEIKSILDMVNVYKQQKLNLEVNNKEIEHKLIEKDKELNGIKEENVIIKELLSKEKDTE